MVIFDPKVYPKYSCIKSITLNNENEVMNLNVFQFISSENIVLFNRNNALKNFNLTKALKVRERNLSIKKAQTFGSKDKKIIMNSLKPTIYDCSLSFGVLCKEAQSIVYSCREAVPRKYEKEWEDKLRTKCEIMPQIQKLSKLGISQTQKSTRKACEAMLKFAQKYWRN